MLNSYKKFFYLLIILGMTSGQVQAYCYPGTCDLSITYAMNKQRTSISDRLDDFIGVVKANREQTNNQNKIIGQEILSYRRLRERIKKEGVLLKNAAYLAKQIDATAVIEQTLKNLKKGK